MADDRTDSANFWVPRRALAAYSTYLALVFALGQLYPLFPWLLVGAVLVGLPMLLIIGRLSRASQTRAWFSTRAGHDSGQQRRGLGALLIIVLIGPAPFLLSASVQELLLGIGSPTAWMLAINASAVFGLIFGGYVVIEALVNRRIARMTYRGIPS